MNNLNYLYVDESGSMTIIHKKQYPYFVIALLWVKNHKQLRRSVKRFVSKHFDKLMEMDKNQKMFHNKKFIELKGSCMTREMKIEFAEYLCRNNLFEVFYVRVDNRKIRENIYDNTDRAFNYIIKKALEYYLKKGILPKDTYIIQLDERNVKTESLNSLEDYLDISFSLETNLTYKVEVEYFNSINNSMIQLADFFSNLFYSECQTGAYCELLDFLKNKGYVHEAFIYPL